MGGDGGDMGSWGGAAEQWGRAVLQEFMEELSRKEDDVHRATKGCGEKLSAELRAAAPRRGAAREHCGGAPHTRHWEHIQRPHSLHCVPIEQPHRLHSVHIEQPHSLH